MKLDQTNSLIDSHFHILEMKKKDIDTTSFLNEWFSSGGSYLLDVGISEDLLHERLKESTNYPKLFHSVGIHPNYAGGDLKNRIEKIENQLNFNKIIAIGETGLDYYWDRVSKDTQKKFFKQHIELSIKHSLPLIIHDREASADIIEILKQYHEKAFGIIHCFSSTPQYAEEYLKLGFYLSYAGNITYKKSISIQESLKVTPLNRLLIETDSPYLSPQKVRGKVNHPGYIGYTLDFISDKLEITRDSILNSIEQNFLQVFNLREE